MYNYSTISNDSLLSCHPELQLVFRIVLETYDHSILVGYRGKDAQEAAFKAGKSKVHYPFGKHNKKPSLAVDVAPYPVDWALLNKKNKTDEEWKLYRKEIYKFYHFAGFVEGIARRLLKEGRILHKIRWGGDWDSDHDFSDQNFDDLVHYELIGR